jgi:transcriptional regulator with XRE-family HTH domain
MNRLELRRWRRERYLTQAGLAELLGVRTNTVTRWEIGNNDLPPFLKLALERLDDLYDWEPDAKNPRRADVA